VAAKPAEQTPFVAQQFVALLYDAGVPRDALRLLHGPGETVGAGLVAAAQTAGVCFTGSTAVAQLINRSLADKLSAPAADGQPSGLLPLIAETGGLNAMLVDSTALPEQVIDAVVQSAFRSAGQRCSALRLLCVHESIADGVIEMLSGALQQLWVGQAADLATDVGPLIDDEAFQNVTQEIARLKREARLIAEAPVHDSLPRLVRPVAFEIARIGDLQQEIFGPVLHVLRWAGDVDAVMEQINALGYGLTLGLQTRIDSRALRLAAMARVGNVYVNRNVIGAVVGVQPFGGEGMSGTGPKAGGPNYLYRFCVVPAAPVLAPLLSELPHAPELAPAPAEAAAASELTAALATLTTGHAAWHQQPLAERVAVLRRAFDGQVGAARLEQRLLRAEQRLADQLLPGPTGESNELRLHGRGVLACLAGAAAAEPLALAICAALVAGNSLALVVDGAAALHAERLQQRLRAAGLPDAALLLLPGGAATLSALLADARVAGACLAGSDALFERQLAQQMAAGNGPIRPLITAEELACDHQQYRFSAEQTLTINTAAAGGNAALLASMH
jgi:RHH-type proline utilization regulon transcriptional repressor/proline dehydrogenase/delta 1-pyrroline-5-carboxylate dehydrogenase